LAAALADVPRILGAMDRNPYRPTYGCLDRNFWHYRTACFPSQMYQEAVLPLAMAYTVPLPENRWHGRARVRELAVAALRYAARSSHPDGSCDDYYPFERALGAAVFSLCAAARAYQVLGLDDGELLDWLRRRAGWLLAHDESGRLANHQALAMLGLWHVGEITRDDAYRQAAQERLRRLLAWQHEEGWFEEYGGADPGYQTLTIDCLAKYRRASGDCQVDEPLGRALRLARLFLHPDGSLGGPYGSRGTQHFFTHGMELLAAENADAADLADGFLESLRRGSQAHFSDDRMFAHRTANLLEAYLDWSPTRPAGSASPDGSATPTTCWLPGGQLLIRRAGPAHTVVSAARGGTFKHFSTSGQCTSDAGLVLQTADGRLAVSQMHDLGRRPDVQTSEPVGLTAGGPLCWVRFETATPLKQAGFHLAMCSVGRWCRTLVRRVLQRRLITGRRPCGARLTRRFEFLDVSASGGPRLRVTDTIELVHARIQVRRMAFASDLEAAYVAASGVYQDSVLQGWTDLAGYVDELNTRRRVVIVREFLMGFDKQEGQRDAAL